MEVWKQIPGYEGLYEASSLGRIRSCEGKTTSNARYDKRVWRQRIIKPKIQRKSYRADERVCLWKDGKEKTHLVSRLVASAFYGVPGDNMTVNHKDGNSLNNATENLEWCTMQENIKHSFETGLCSSICKETILTNTKSGEQSSFRSESMAGKWIGRSSGYISSCVKRNRMARSLSGDLFAIVLR